MLQAQLDTHEETKKVSVFARPGRTVPPEYPRESRAESWLDSPSTAMLKLDR